MPLFFFDLTRGSSVTPDRTGIDLADEAAMRARAEAMAKAVTRESRGGGVAVQVRDGHGRTVHASVAFGGR